MYICSSQLRKTKRFQALILWGKLWKACVILWWTWAGAGSWWWRGRCSSSGRRSPWACAPAPPHSTLRSGPCTARKILFIYSFSGELHSLSHNFHIHVSVSDLYIPRIGPHISLEQNRQTNPGNIWISLRYMSLGTGRQNIIILGTRHLYWILTGRSLAVCSGYAV